MAEDSPESEPFVDVWQPLCCCPSTTVRTATTEEQTIGCAPQFAPMRNPLTPIVCSGVDWTISVYGN